MEIIRTVLDRGNEFPIADFQHHHIVTRQVLRFHAEVKLRIPNRHHNLTCFRVSAQQANGFLYLVQTRVHRLALGRNTPVTQTPAVGSVERNAIIGKIDHLAVEYFQEFDVLAARNYPHSFSQQEEDVDVAGVTAYTAAIRVVDDGLDVEQFAYLTSTRILKRERRHHRAVDIRIHLSERTARVGKYHTPPIVKLETANARFGLGN